MCYSTWDTLVVYNISTKYEYPPAAFDTRKLGARGQRCTPCPAKHPCGPAPQNKGNTLESFQFRKAIMKHYDCDQNGDHDYECWVY